MNEQHPSQEKRVVASAGSYYRNARYVMFALCLVMGGWFLYDGFVRYPQQNHDYDIIIKTGQVPSYQKHTNMDIALQKLLGVALPILGGGLLAWWLYRSRGSFTLSGTSLRLPSSETVNLDQIRKVDKRLWDRKGIAVIEYESAGSKEPRTFVLDDFVYEAQPVRDILKAIEDHLKSAAQPAKL